MNISTKGLVAEESVARVVAAAAQLGYRPDRLAASLRTGLSRHVGILLPDVNNSAFSPILSGATERLSAEGYMTIIVDAGVNPDLHVSMIDELLAHRVDGLILATAQLEDPGVGRCLERELPIVLVNRCESRPRVSAIVSDDMNGVQAATEHLLALGHVEIAYVGGSESQSTGQMRRRGFEAALARRGLRPSPGGILIADAYSRDEGARLGRLLLSQSKPYTAIVAANDLLALGIYDVLRDFGLSCPGDISVVGYNDIPLMDIVSPPLTTMRVDHRAMGWEAAELLLLKMHREDMPVQNVILPSELIVRASTAAPAPSALSTRRPGRPRRRR